MPRNVLRQFTGGISNEIDPQNLREDQGEEALDINLKGFALEPGDGLEELTDAGHYHYRGEWIRDSEAVSFEESGIGVIKTFDTKRPQFEEIINDDENVSRNLGPSLPPDSIITGSVVSEGSRGLRPAEGSHLLKIESNKLGVVDTGDKDATPPYSDAPSLEEHRADTNATDKKIYYYSGQPYWIDDSDSANWKVVTRQPNGSGGWTTNLIETASPLIRHSGGYLFKENYFICWDGQFIETVQLSTSSMTVNSFDTVDAGQGGNAGSDFGFTSGATGQEISSVDICNGVITFAQKIKTTNTTPTAYTGSADERWILPPATDSILLLIRDGQTDGESEGNWDAGSDDIEIWAKTGSNPPEKQGGKATWQTPSIKIKNDFDSNWDRVTTLGLKWAASIVKANTWTKVKVSTNKPQFYFVNKSNKAPTQTHIDQITVDERQNRRKVISINKQGFPGGGPESYSYYTTEPVYTFKIPYFDFEIEYTHSSMPTSTGQYWASYYWYSQWVNQGNALALNHKRTFQYHYSQYTGRGGVPTRQYSWAPSMGADWQTKFTLTSSASVKRNSIANSSRHSTARGNLKTNVITGSYDSFINRLCSYTPLGSMTIQTGFARSKIWTQATISRSDQSITFAAADTKTFTVGDYIKVQANGNRTLSWNTSARKVDSWAIQPSNGNMHILKKEDRDHVNDYFLAKITSISNSANKLYLERTDQTESNNPFVDEECYPIINSIDPFKAEGKDKDGERTGIYVFKDAAGEEVLDGSEREVLQTDLFGHVLIGHRPPLEPNLDTKQTIEVRANSGAEATNSDYKHIIKWKDGTDGMLDVRAVTATSGSQPRIFYVKGTEGNQKLYSQNGTDSDVAPSSRVFSNAGVYYVTSDYLSVVDDNSITVYDPYYNVKYSKDKPEQAVGLGITGDVEDALHLISSSVVFVFVKIRPSGAEDGTVVPAVWKLVKTGSTKPETSILSYDFVKPLHFDGLKVWGITRTNNTDESTEKYDVHTAIPFFESDLKNTWVNHSSSSNNVSAWGQVTKTREGKLTDQGTPRYLSVEWKFDSGVYNNTGDPTIGLNHEANKMLGNQNEFTWYILDAPATLQSGGVGSQITNPKLEIKFKSQVIRNVAFFKTAETVVPSQGQTGANNRISFTNYQEAGQNFYVLNDNAIILKGGVDAKERGYLLGNADAANNEFDASKVGVSAFLVGAPNMFNPYGPNIDFYYRASFIDKWGNESAPSTASAEGIQPLDSADDCIQINFDEHFFHFDNPYIETIRVYRYGGDSSEWMFLRDIDMPDLTNFPLTLGSSDKLTGSFARVSALSKFYNFKTFKDITRLRNFTNSNFDLLAVGLGSSVTFTASTTNETITTASPHGLVVGDQVRLSGTDLPEPLVEGAVGTKNNLYYVESQTANNKITLSSTKSGNDVFTTSGSFTNPLVINDVGHGLTNNTVIHVTNIDGALPGGLAIDTNYYVINKADDTFQISTSEGGSAIIWGGDGTGTHSWHKPIVFSDAGSGTRSLRKYMAPSDMDGSWNIIQLSENESPSVAYTTTLSSEINETATTIALASTTNWPTTGVVKIEEEYISYGSISGTSLTECKRAQYDSSESRHEAAKAVNVIEWVLEIEHRNQDTTTLEADHEIGATTLYVEDAALFKASGKVLIGNEIFNYTGRDLTKSPNELTGVSNNSAGSLPKSHTAGVTVFSYEEDFTSQDVEQMSIEINSFGYRDKARAPVTSLHYLQNDNYPPVGLTYNEEKKNFYETDSNDDYYRYIRAVGSMYFGALDANLQFSRYGTPEYWPLDAVVTLDSEIRAIMEHAGEGLVWTTNSLYRVRGTDPKAMVAFRVPDAHGIKDGDEQTVATFGGGVLWLTANDGIAYYQAGKVQYLTRDKHIITNLVKPRALVADGVYWLFQKPGNGTGFRLEITNNDLRLCKTSIEGYYAHYSKALGKAIVVTKDDEVSDSDSTFSVSEIGSTKATNISWKSKKIDAGEPALAKALGSLAVVYEVLDSKSAVTLSDGIRGQSLAASLLGMNPDDLDAGDLAAAGADAEVDMYDVFINYGNAEQYFEIDIGGGNLSETERKKIVMPLDFDTSTIKAGDRIWNEMLADNTIVSSVTTAVVGGVTYPALLLDKEPLRSGSGTIYWGNLPVVDVFLNNDTTAARTFVLPPSDRVEPLSADLYLNDLRRFRTISVKIQGNVRVQTLSIRHYPLQQYQAHTLTHSADVFYKGDIDFRVMLDGKLIYRKELTNPEGEFKEERVYLPASSYGQRIHYMNESMSGTIESVQFNGNMAA